MSWLEKILPPKIQPSDAAEQQVSERIAGYLARLRGKTAFAGSA